jgi:hypothetical protein
MGGQEPSRYERQGVGAVDSGQLPVDRCIGRPIFLSDLDVLTDGGRRDAMGQQMPNQRCDVVVESPLQIGQGSTLFRLVISLEIFGKLP